MAAEAKTAKKQETATVAKETKTKSKSKSTTKTTSGTKVAIVEINNMQYVAKAGVAIPARVSPEADSASHEVKLLGLIDGDSFEFGTPYLDKKLDFTFGETIKDQKVVASKFKAKSRYRRKVGHRENYVQFTLNSIG